MPITEPGVGASNWGPTLNTALTQLDTIGASAGYHTQTLASNGAVTVDASTGQIQNVLLQANATSTSITNGQAGQRLTLMFQQDGSGAHTVVWPTAKYTAATAPTVTSTANARSSVTYVYDGTVWVEQSRALDLR